MCNFVTESIKLRKMKFEITIVHQAEALFVTTDPHGDSLAFETLEEAEKYAHLMGLEMASFRVKVWLQNQVSDGANLNEAICNLMKKFGWRVSEMHDVTHDASFPSLRRALQN